MSAWIILYGLVQANSNKFFFNKYFEQSNLGFKKMDFLPSNKSFFSNFIFIYF